MSWRGRDFGKRLPARRDWLCACPRYLCSDRSVVLGHEFYGEVVDHGPWSAKRLKPGAPVVRVPLVRRGRQVVGIGLAAQAPGGYAEQPKGKPSKG